MSSHLTEEAKEVEPFEPRQKRKTVVDDGSVTSSRDVEGIARIPRVEDEEDETVSFFRRYRTALILITVAVAIAVFLMRMVSGTSSSGRRESAVVAISLPPPPPPPPVQQPPPEPKMMEQQTFQPEEKPEEEPPKPPDQPPLGTNIKGNGAENGFGLGTSGGNGLGGQGSGSSRFGWYAGKVQSRVAEALRGNRKTRTAEMAVEARIWSDATGHITRAQLAGSTGSADLDTAIKNEVLLGLQLSEPPPDGMPMPIVLRLTAKRPR
jgi:periplasmic protein TonB